VFLRRFFSHGDVKSESSRETVVISLDYKVYEKLKDRALADGETESDALVRAFERGMDTYWANQIRSEQEDYELVKVLFEQSKHDHMLLEAIIKQNMELRKILESTSVEREAQGGVQ
jgi:hypothetical protein